MYPWVFVCLHVCGADSSSSLVSRAAQTKGEFLHALPSLGRRRRRHIVDGKHIGIVNMHTAIYCAHSGLCVCTFQVARRGADGWVFEKRTQRDNDIVVDDDDVDGEEDDNGDDDDDKNKLFTCMELLNKRGAVLRMCVCVCDVRME